MQIAKNTVARFEYTLTDDKGTVIDTSEGQEPLAYVHGKGNIIPGLEEEMEGKTAGDAFKVSIPAAKGYGERDENMVHDIPRTELPPDVQVEVGMQFQAESEHGTHLLTVVGVAEDTVKMDANHPLAGVTLNFDVKIVEVREATAEELQHGHVHGPGGHDH